MKKDYKEKMPLVTVFTMTYRNLKFMKDTILSVLRQTYSQIEFILADDGTIGFPLHEIETFIDENRRENIVCYEVFTQSQNVGTVKNANSIIGKAKGKYVFPLSCGDEFYENSTIEKIVTRFEATNCDVLCCRRLLCTEKELNPIRHMPATMYLNKIEKIDNKGEAYSAIVLQRFYEMASGAATYYTKKILCEMGGFDTGYRLWEDGPFYVQYLRRGGKLNFQYDIISIRYRDGGVSKSKNKYMVQDVHRFIKKEMMDNIHLLGGYDVRYAKYLYHWTFDKKQLLNLIKYFDVVAYRFLYKVYCCYCVEKDKVEIRRQYNADS